MFWRDFFRSIRGSLLSPEKLAVIALKLVHIVVIVGVAWLVAWLVGRAVKRTLSSRLARKPGARTALTIARSLSYYVFFFIALVMVLRVIGVDFTAILAGAGVVGLAVGFGAQTLVRDFLAGFFLLFEDAVNVGDFLVVGEISGTVEYVGVRRTQLRAFDGTLYTIPNGELTRFGNLNRGYMRAVVKVDLAYEQDVELGMALARRVAESWYAEHEGVALAPPEVQGLLSFGESGLTIRIVAPVRPLQHWAAERELRVMLKQAFDEDGVEVPFPRRVVYIKPDKPGGSKPD